MRKYFFENVGEGAPGGKGLRPDFPSFLSFLSMTRCLTQKPSETRKNETRIKRPRFFYLIYLAPRKSPLFCFFASTRTGGALSLVHPSFTKKVPGEQAFLWCSHSTERGSSTASATEWREKRERVVKVDQKKRCRFLSKKKKKREKEEKKKKK
jgi:hypothetical protein